jgi:hypothetical protein
MLGVAGIGYSGGYFDVLESDLSVDFRVEWRWMDDSKQ